VAARRFLGLPFVTVSAHEWHIQDSMCLTVRNCLRNWTEADWLPSKPMPGTLKEAFMSQRNGDKARFDRQRKKKSLHRKRIRDLRKVLALQNKTTPAP
jgi:hypothetical protein